MIAGVFNQSYNSDLPAVDMWNPYVFLKYIICFTLLSFISSCYIWYLYIHISWITEVCIIIAIVYIIIVCIIMYCLGITLTARDPWMIVGGRWSLSLWMKSPSPTWTSGVSSSPTAILALLLFVSQKRGDEEGVRGDEGVRAGRRRRWGAVGDVRRRGGRAISFDVTYTWTTFNWSRWVSPQSPSKPSPPTPPSPSSSALVLSLKRMPLFSSPLLSSPLLPSPPLLSSLPITSF